MTSPTAPNSNEPAVADSVPVETEPVEFGRPMPMPTASRSGRGGTIAVVLATFVAVAGIAFAGGRLTAPAAAASDGGLTGGPTGRFGPGASFAPGGNGAGRQLDFGGTTLRGEATAISADSITVRLQDGSSVTVALDADTTYHQATPATPDAVQVGDDVAVQAGAPSFSAGSSPATGGPGSSVGGAGGIQFGPAVDVTVTSN